MHVFRVFINFEYIRVANIYKYMNCRLVRYQSLMTYLTSLNLNNFIIILELHDTVLFGD